MRRQWYIGFGIVLLITLALFAMLKSIGWFIAFLVPILILWIYDLLQKKHTILRNFPVLGHVRYFLEFLRPEIQQYFIATDESELPFNRETRSLIYERSKNVRDTIPFGTERDILSVGYTWALHSLAPKHASEVAPRITVGGPDCLQPYNASRLNISAMSFGSLSGKAIIAMNKGAMLGGFSQNTGEGGTGAAPVEYANFIGTPLEAGLVFVHNALVGVNLRDKIRIICNGKVTNGFDLLTNIALGADMCGAARAMMLATGCLQTKLCNTNMCPTGITTQSKRLQYGLVVDEKKYHVANFHTNTMKSFLEMVGAPGLDNPSDLKPHHIMRRISVEEVKTFDQIYEYLNPGQLLTSYIPESYKIYWENASPERF